MTTFSFRRDETGRIDFSPRALADRSTSPQLASTRCTRRSLGFPVPTSAVVAPIT